MARLVSFVGVLVPYVCQHTDRTLGEEDHANSMSGVGRMSLAGRDIEPECKTSDLNLARFV